MDVVKQALHTDNVLNLQLLQQLGRQSIRKVLLEQHSVLTIGQYQALWARLQRTACKVTVTDRHLTAACNAICVFLTDASHGFNAELQNFAYSKETWAEGFVVVCKSFSNGKIKPALQVLGTLLQLLEEDKDQSSARLTAQSAVDEMVCIVISAQPEMRVKEACTILLVFLRKFPYLSDLSETCRGLEQRIRSTFKQRCLQYRIDTSKFDADAESPVYMFFLGLLLNIHIPESRTAAMKLFAFLCSKGPKHDNSGNVVLASDIIQVYLGANQTSLADFSAEIFPAILNTKDQFHIFLEQYQPSTQNDALTLEIYLVLLEVGRRQVYFSELELAQNLNHRIGGGKYTIDFAATKWKGFDILLAHKNPAYRLRGYNMLTMSHETNREILCEVFECLEMNFKNLHDDSDAYYRDLHGSISHRFLTRFAKSAQTVLRQHQKQQSGLDLSPILQRYARFLNTYLKFLICELSPHVSYPRHILALQVLQQIFECEIFDTEILNGTEIVAVLIQPLINLVLDPYEDVRAMSTTVLNIINRKDYELIATEFETKQTLLQAQQLSARTNRSDHADALGQLYLIDCIASAQLQKSCVDALPPKQNQRRITDLVFTLKDHLLSINQLQPTSSFPLHGTLSGLAYCLNSTVTSAWSSCFSLGMEILEICTTVWNLVQTELCIDSPERATEYEVQDELSGPKDLLAYSWRALRDSSLLMQALIGASSIFGTELYKMIGDLCLIQLAQLRHRGAFSTVTQTFVLCCQAIRKCKAESLQLELRKWQLISLDEIHNQSTQLTRRSAGLPAMFTGLLDPSDRPAFKSAMDELKTIATQNVSEINGSDATDPNLPQVHALNCIKEVMLNSRFRTVTEPMVVTILNLAAQSLGSQQWAIRNCGLMLFRACINRLTSEIMTTFHSSTENSWPNTDSSPIALATKLLENIDDSNETTRPDIVFAALDLLGRIPVHIGTEGVVQQLAERQLGHPLWAVREHAARLRASTVSSEGWRPAVSLQLLTSEMQEDDDSTNLLHGRLLCTRFILQHHWIHAAAEPVSFILHSIMKLHSMTMNTLKRGCDAFVLAAILDIVNDAYSGSLEHKLDCFTIEECSNQIMSACASRSDQHQNFLLHRSLQLNAVFQHLWNVSMYRIPNKENRSRKRSYNSYQIPDHMDTDVALYVLSELAKMPAESLPIGVSDVYIAFIMSSYHESVTALAIQILFTHLQGSTKALTATQSRSLTTALNCQNLNSRELFNSQVTLSAILLPQVIQTAWDRPSELILRFVDLLQQSFLDDIEVPTRLNAITAIGAIQEYLLRGGICGLAFTESDRLRVLLMLYDCLNDDDDDIRGLASKIFCKLVSNEHHPDLVRLSCPAKTRSMLQQLLFNDFGDNSLLAAWGCGKIIGAPILSTADELFGLSKYCQTHTVAIMIERAIKLASELFAEEKQNLYIDMVAEFQNWAQRVKMRKLEIISNEQQRVESLTKLLFEWALNGVHALIGLLDPDHHAKIMFGPMGPTYNEDILIIFIRVLTTAQILLYRIQVTADNCSDRRRTPVLASHGNVGDLTGALGTLRSMCHQQNAHQLVLDNIETTLAMV